MLTTAALFLYLFQAGGAGASHPGRLVLDCVWCVEDGFPAAEEPQPRAKYEEQELFRRFNRLAEALTEFSKTYNSLGVIDVKKVKAIRKAMHDLEKSDWFSPKGEGRASR
jgi:hypothetical protein